MANAILIAKIAGIAYLSIGIGFLVNPGLYKNLMADFVKNTGLVYITGIMTLVIGMLMMNAYSVWSCSWTVIITIFGLIATLKGIMFLAFPKPFLKMAIWFSKKKILPVAVIFVLALGLVLTYFGFFAV